MCAFAVGARAFDLGRLLDDERAAHGGERRERDAQARHVRAPDRDALRLFETTPGADGAFSFKNLPPGRYLLLARVTSDATDAAPRPASWDTDSRTRLRREAEAANTTVELQPCQRATDFTLRFPPPAPK